MWKSHFTQGMLNYFDDTDIRVRTLPYTLDAQLLNSFAQSMEGNNLRVTREVGSRTLKTCPLNIDNLGVYYAFQIPSNVPLPTDSAGNILPLTSVSALSGVDWIPLSNYSDILPVPSRIQIDTTVDVVPMTSPILFEMTGTDDPQIVTPTMPLPNRILFWLDQLGGSSVTVEIRIQGSIYPQTVWVSEEVADGEEVVMIDAGPVESNLVWQDITSIIIHGLPAGARLRAYSIPFNLDGVPDIQRPYIGAYWRGQIFPRFWTVNNQLLQEMYVRNRFAGFDYAQSYLMPAPPVDVAIEPNTFGLFTASGTMLYYADRREPLPDNLTDTGISIEPLYGLNGGYDTSHPGNLRYLHISADAYVGAPNLVQYRYLLTDPTNAVYALDSNGYLLQFKGNAGWRPGPPPTINVPLTLTGTYLITLEMLDQNNNITRDYFPWTNPVFTPLAALDISTLVPSIQGLAFDCHQRLWVWTGTYAVPLKLFYDGYVFDPTTSTVYLTDNYPQIQING